MALDGLAAYLETIRNLVISSIESDEVEQPVVPSPKISKSQMIMGMIPDAECIHESTIDVDTLGGTSIMCNDCGLQL